MKNVWKGMVVGAMVGSALDAAGLLGRRGKTLADNAILVVKETDVAEKVRDIAGRG